MKLKSIQQQAIDNPDGYWQEAAQGIDWITPPTRILQTDNSPFNRWFMDGELNTCYNAVDRHVLAGRGEQVAIIYDSAMTGSKQQYTYRKLQIEVARLAGALRRQGVQKGDRVVIYLPMIPQALFAMLACARIGAVHSVVFGGFSGQELAKRIDDAKPKLILSASCGIEPNKVIAYQPLIKEALKLAAHRVDCVVIYQRDECAVDLDAQTLDWQAWLADAQPADCVSLAATDPLYILYTSGTTGSPKGVVRDNGGHAVALYQSMQQIYNVQPGEVFWSASDVGWVVGHSYICYAPLLMGCTTILYEGKPVGTPDAGAFWRIIEDYRVKVLFTAPTAIRAIRREDPNGEKIKNHDLNSLSALFLAGEHCDPKTLAWCSDTLQVPVVDHWWQTETGWAIAANCLGIEIQANRSSSVGHAVPGYHVQVLDDNGELQAANQTGNIAIKLPLPPGTLTTLWQDDERFVNSYMQAYPGYYLTGDSGYFDSDGYLYVMGRIDDVINVAGHRLSTGLMEEILSAHSDVAECAVVGVKNRLKGQIPLALIVLKSGASSEETVLLETVIQQMREGIGAVAAFKLVGVVSKLPKTRSGKILRSTIRAIADNTPFTMPATIEDPSTLDEAKRVLATLGYPRDQDLDISISEHKFIGEA